MSRTDTDIPGHVRLCPGGRTRTSPFKGCPYVRPSAATGQPKNLNAGPYGDRAAGGTLSRFISIGAEK